MAERPDRVSIPGILSEHASRLRALERSRPGFVPPKGDDFIELWDEGVPQGLVRALDFVGSGVQALTTGDERGIVNISGGGAGGWDAIVDGTAVASDPDARLFLGIGEACIYLDALGMESVNILVRNNSTGFSGSADVAYIEPANFNSPASVHLFGLRGRTDPYGSGINPTQTGILWNMAGFRPLSSGGVFSPPDFYIHNFALVQPGVWATPFFRCLGLVHSGFSTTSAVKTGSLCTRLEAIESWFDLTNSTVLSSGVCLMSMCDVALRSTSSSSMTCTLGASQLLMVGCSCGDGSGGSGGTRTLSLPDTFDIDIRTVSSPENRSGLGISPGMAITIPSAASGRIRSLSNLGLEGPSVSAPFALSKLILEGIFFGISILSGEYLNLDVTCIGNLTVGPIGPGFPPPIIRAQVQGNLDVAHSHIEVALEGPNRSATFRGVGPVTGALNCRSVTRTAGALLNYIGASWGHLVVAYNEANASGTASPYAFDAASNDNLLIMKGTTDWPVLGTDAGLRNQVFPEDFGGTAGAAPANADYLVGTANAGLSTEIVVGPTPGGELGNTWAAPTVDATHSGSAHANFIAKVFLDAKGDLISATADNTPALVAVGADGEVLTADSTDPAGVSWQPGGGSMTFGSPVESQFGNTGSDGIGTDAARDDHVHDRHDDAILYLTRMI